MARASIPDLLTDGKVMSAGIRANIEALGRRGMAPDFADKLDANLQQANVLNGEQETLKAALKQKTAELNTLVERIRAQVSEATKIVKLDQPQEAWKAFGITAKR